MYYNNIRWRAYSEKGLKGAKLRQQCSNFLIHINSKYCRRGMSIDSLIPIIMPMDINNNKNL